MFTVVFPRTKGQPSSQVLWWRPLTPRAVLIGVEEGWCGFGRISIDWRSVDAPGYVPATLDLGGTPSVRPQQGSEVV